MRLTLNHLPRGKLEHISFRRGDQSSPQIIEIIYCTFSLFDATHTRHRHLGEHVARSPRTRDERESHSRPTRVRRKMRAATLPTCPF